jgi:hypothetical protein
VGAEALSWAAKKLEPSKIGLATSPSTTAVQDRVLQAAAKHESKPSDTEESSTKADSFASEAWAECVDSIGSHFAVSLVNWCFWCK